MFWMKNFRIILKRVNGLNDSPHDFGENASEEMEEHGENKKELKHYRQTSFERGLNFLLLDMI